MPMENKQNTNKTRVRKIIPQHTVLSVFVTINRLCLFEYYQTKIDGVNSNKKNQQKTNQVVSRAIWLWNEKKVHRKKLVTKVNNPSHHCTTWKQLRTRQEVEDERRNARKIQVFCSLFAKSKRLHTTYRPTNTDKFPWFGSHDFPWLQNICQNELAVCSILIRNEPIRSFCIHCENFK